MHLSFSLSPCFHYLIVSNGNRRCLWSLREHEIDSRYWNRSRFLKCFFKFLDGVDKQFWRLLNGLDYFLLNVTKRFDWFFRSNVDFKSLFFRITHRIHQLPAFNLKHINIRIFIVHNRFNNFWHVIVHKHLRNNFIFNPFHCIWAFELEALDCLS